MVDIVFPELNNKVVSFDVAQGGESQPEPMFALGIRKCGSSIFYSMINALCIHSNVKFVDVAGRLFEEGVTTPFANRNTQLSEMIENGNVYGGFRSFPVYFKNSQKFKQARKVFLIRDPRDALVSEYFSNAYSHSMPKGDPDSPGFKEMENLRANALNAQLETYIKERVNPMIHTFMEYKDLLNDPNVKVFKYEEIIFDKKALLRDVGAHLGLSYTELLLDQIMGWADKRPDTESPTEFVRKVTPGDWKEKLTEEFQSVLTAEVSEVLNIFNYAK